MTIRLISPTSEAFVGPHKKEDAYYCPVISVTETGEETHCSGMRKIDLNTHKNDKSTRTAIDALRAIIGFAEGIGFTGDMRAPTVHLKRRLLEHWCCKKHSKKDVIEQ